MKQLLYSIIALITAMTASAVDIHVTLENAGTLEEMLEIDIAGIDSLTISGPLDDNDCYKIRMASIYGKLTYLNLEHSVMPDNEIALGSLSDRITVNGERLYSKYRKVILPERVTLIDCSAFAMCEDLEEVVFPPALKEISPMAFWGCENLKNIELPEGLETIGESAFECGVSSVSLPSTLRFIGGAAFRRSCIETIDLPENLETISSWAFSWSSLRHIRIPESCSTLDIGALEHCSNLESVIFPESMTIIELGMLQCCENLKIVHLPSDVKEIYGSAFARTGLEKIEFPEGLEKIYGMAFHASSLESVELPSTVTAIGAGAFANCSRLSSLTCKALIPPACDSDDRQFLSPFEDSGNIDTGLASTPSNIPVYVPLGRATIYSLAPGWNYFTNFIETDFSGITETVSEGSIKTVSGKIVIEGMEGVEYTVISCDGCIIASGYADECTTIMPDKGFYIIRVGKKTAKVLL